MPRTRFRTGPLALSALPLLVVAPQGAMAQEADSRSAFDPTRWGVVYEIPAMREVTLRADVPYLRDDRGTLTLDVYLPPDAGSGGARPAVVFLNAIGDRPGDKVKHWEIYRSWPRLVAAHGLVGVSMEADGDRIQECLGAVFTFLTEHGAELGVDGSRLGVYAASANVSVGAAYLLGETCSQGIRAAALYYGRPPAGVLRDDLPVLFIVAESDAPGMEGELSDLWGRVVATKAPWTLTFAADLPHAFDAFSDNDEARRLIGETIAFWKAHLEPVPQPSWEPSPARAVVASLYAHDPERAAGALESWVAEHPEDAAGFAEYGRVLTDLQRYPEATRAFDRALALGSTDPGIYHGMGRIAMGTQRWSDAVTWYERALEGGRTWSQVYGGLALAQLQLGRNDEAVRSYEKAFEAGIPPGRNTRGVAWYNLACGYARLGRTDQAFEALGEAVKEGLDTRADYDSDPDLAPLRNDPRYAELLGRMPEPPGP